MQVPRLPRESPELLQGFHLATETGRDQLLSVTWGALALACDLPACHLACRMTGTVMFTAVSTPPRARNTVIHSLIRLCKLLLPQFKDEESGAQAKSS